MLLSASAIAQTGTTAPGVPQSTPVGVPSPTAAQSTTGSPVSSAQSQQIAAQRLSLADALRMAQARSYLAAGSAARLFGADARVRGARMLQNPSLILSKAVGNNTGAFGQDIQLTQTFELGDKRRQRVRSAMADQSASFADRAGVLADLTLTVQTAYFESLRSEAERQLAIDALTAAQTFAQAAATQFEAGDVPRSNVVRSGIEQARAEQLLQTAETESANRSATLASLIGMPAGSTIALTDTLAFTPKNHSLPALQEAALRNRPELQSAKRLRESRLAALHSARIQGQPDLFVEGIHGSFDPAIPGDSLRVGVTFPLFDYGRNRADAGAAKAALQEQDAVVSETERTVRLSVETAWRTLELARRSVESFRAGRLDRASELLEMARTGYAKGANSFLELLDAQQVYRLEQTDYARALADFNIAAATLQRAAGGTFDTLP